MRRLPDASAVTGAIGRATAYAFARKGARLALVARASDELEIAQEMSGLSETRMPSAPTLATFRPWSRFEVMAL
jgi:NAD(P)-dependent dehydrogenase (short-subunit alcohol dehydrogenase family)